MNAEQFAGLFRHILTVAGAYFVTKGVTDAGTVEMVGGAATTLAAVGWSFWSKR
jgi:hypothetical protein